MNDARFNFEGRDNSEIIICQSEITFVKFLPIIKSEGCGMHDSMYYIHVEGKGVSRLVLI